MVVLCLVVIWFALTIIVREDKKQAEREKFIEQLEIKKQDDCKKLIDQFMEDRLSR